MEKHQLHQESIYLVEILKKLHELCDTILTNSTSVDLIGEDTVLWVSTGHGAYPQAKALIDVWPKESEGVLAARQACFAITDTTVVDVMRAQNIETGRVASLKELQGLHHQLSTFELRK